MADKSIAQIFKLISKAKTREKRIAVLKDYSTFSLRTILQTAVHPDIKLPLDPGVPNAYTLSFKTPIGKFPKTGKLISIKDPETGKVVGKAIPRPIPPIKPLDRMLFLEFPHFIPDHPNFMKDKNTREKLWFDFLYCIHPREAKILIHMKDKDLLEQTDIVGSLSYDEIQEAWPELELPDLEE